MGKSRLKGVDKIPLIPNNGYMATVSIQPKTLLTLLAERGRQPPQVARLIGVSREAVGKWCRGVARPTPYHFDRLRLVLLCTPDELNAALDATKTAKDGERS